MGLITKALITKKAPIPPGGAGRITFTGGLPKTSLDESLLRYYNEIGWLRAGVSLIASSVAQATWRLYRKTKDGDREEVTGSHPLKELLNQPNPWQSGHDFLEQHQILYELLGRVFWIKERNAGMNELWIAPPQNIKILPDKVNYIKGFEYSREGFTKIFDPNEVIFFLEANPLDPLAGVGRAASIGIDIEMQSFMAQYNRNFFYWGAEPGTVISYPPEANIPPEELDKIKEQWEAAHRSYGRAHRTAIVTQGATISTTDKGHRDMDFVNQAKMLRENILGGLGVSYSLLGGTESINRANADAQMLNFTRWTTTPRLVKIRSKMNMGLCPDYDDDLELDFDNPVPEDTEQQATVIDNHIKAGVFSLEEGRAMLRKGDIDPEHHFLVPVNYSVVPGSELIGEATPPPSAKPPIPPKE